MPDAPCRVATSLTDPPLAEACVLSVGPAGATVIDSPPSPHPPVTPLFFVSPANEATHLYEPAFGGVNPAEV